MVQFTDFDQREREKGCAQLEKFPSGIQGKKVGQLGENKFDGRGVGVRSSWRDSTYGKNKEKTGQGKGNPVQRR